MKTSALRSYLFIVRLFAKPKVFAGLYRIFYHESKLEINDFS
ncbi:MAG: hypothetical protein AAGM40_05735 [Cyanobacteria bacterium J06573_2]